MELFLSYSLQDFLLFSAETWFFLYLEFTREWWWLAVVAGGMSMASVLTRLKACQFAFMMTLLLSMIIYYRTFYIEINGFAIYLVILLAVQLVLYVFWIWRQQDKGQWYEARFVKSLSLNKHKAELWIFVLSVVAFISLPLFTIFEPQWTLFLLFFPGWQACSSGLLFVFFTRYYQRIPFFFLLPIIIVIISELLTFQVLLLPYWWIGIIALIGAAHSRH